MKIFSKIPNYFWMSSQIIAIDVHKCNQNIDVVSWDSIAIIFINIISAQPNNSDVIRLQSYPINVN
jgi:hypothetical protein